MDDYPAIKITPGITKRVEERVRRDSLPGARVNQFGHESHLRWGYYGEEIVKEYFGQVYHDNKSEYDLAYRLNKLEVKAVNASARPEPDFEASVNAAKGIDRKQACDYFVFTRIKNDYSLGWIVGYIERDLFFKIAIYRGVGEVLYIKKNGQKVYVKNNPIRQCKIRDLYHIQILRDGVFNNGN